jgi:hypothetical protein
LSEFERSLLDYLSERIPSKTQDELVQGVFSRGLVILVSEEREREGRVVTGQGKRHTSSTLGTLGSMRPFPKRDYEPPSAVPKNLTIQLDDELRGRLEAVLTSRRGETLDGAIDTLLGLGLDQIKKDPGALDPARVFERFKEEPLSAKAAARARRRRRVARLHAIVASR